MSRFAVGGHGTEGQVPYPSSERSGESDLGDGLLEFYIVI
ncbi:hypothetical protein GCM10028868_38940 [Virgibacillus kimchii]